MIAVADATHLPLADKSVDLVMGSPPYDVARTYGIGADRKCDLWVEWMLKVTEEAMRVCRGAVLWVAAGTSNYNPGPEGLMWEGRNRGWFVARPCIWTKNAAPTGKGWFSNDWEFIMAFAPNRKHWSAKFWDPEAIGTPLKYKAGGHFRQRKQDGSRSRGGDYPTHKVRKRPSNVFYVTVGGGHMGSELSKENEAAYPEKLVEPFILSLCPLKRCRACGFVLRPGHDNTNMQTVRAHGSDAEECPACGESAFLPGLILDPFSGSGTTASVALQHGRRFIATDIRPSQAELTRRRIKETQTCLHF